MIRLRQKIAHKTKIIRVSLKFFNLLTAVELLSSNDNAKIVKGVEASNILTDKFIKFASWDITDGARIIDEYAKVAKHNGL